MKFIQTPSLLTFVFAFTACATSMASEITPEISALEIEQEPSKWGYVLVPIHAGTEDADGTLRIWHSRIGSQHYSTKLRCLEAAKEGLEYLGGEAWNYKAKCESPVEQHAPIAITSFNSESKSLDRHTLNALCFESGGIAGNFGDQRDGSNDEVLGNQDAIETLLDPTIGPFLTFERWYTPSGAISTLRYIAPTTELITQKSLADMIEPLAEETGWDRIPKASTGTQDHWYKLVGNDSSPDLLMLFSDGGLASTSLYCVRRKSKQLNAQQRKYVINNQKSE